MADPPDQPLDLDAHVLSPGEATQVPASLALPAVTLGGQEYMVAPAPTPATIDISVGTTGRTFRLRLEGELVGVCWRCVTETRTAFSMDSWEYQHDGRAPDQDEEGLDCAYLDADLLDVARWAQDAIIEGLPNTIVCRRDCAGICSGCGTNLNTGTCSCEGPRPDPRWAGLAELADRLKDSS
ncbi:MAG: DUF177 domain-containing protein [Thermoleophilia bacterium]|nr:DUF177 domain-containing protein [Thermoleophilia bacterium]